MKVEVITCMYNEQFLLPFFLKHYDWVDKINVIYDQDSNDNTLEMLKANPKVNVIPFKFPDMMDELLKVKKINEVYKNLRGCNRILLVDADEFIFIDRYRLESLKFPVVNVKLFDVYRHISESDLDPNKPAREQRSHGVFVEIYNKPIIAKAELDIEWRIGNHSIMRRDLKHADRKIIIKKLKNYVVNQRFAVAYDCGVIGAHWANADSCFCVERRIKGRRDRQSKVNLEHKFTYQHHNISEESVLAECKMHENDPKVF